MKKTFFILKGDCIRNFFGLAWRPAIASCLKTGDNFWSSEIEEALLKGHIVIVDDRPVKIKLFRKLTDGSLESALIEQTPANNFIGLMNEHTQASLEILLDCSLTPVTASNPASV